LFKGDANVSLMDLMNIKRFNSENIDGFLNQFKQLISKCFTQINNSIGMVAIGLTFPIKKQLVN